MSIKPSSIRLANRPALRALAKKRGTSVSAIVNEAVYEYLMKLERKRKRQNSKASN